MTHDDRDEAVKRLVRRHWDGRAATFDDESRHGIHTDEQRERWLSVLREWTGDPPRRVLDVGCGTGVLSLLLAAVGHDVTGVDFAPEMLERTREKVAAVAFRAGDAIDLELPDDGYDAVTARHLLWTLPDPADALREWRRVVRPGGWVVPVEGHWDHDEPWDEYRRIHADLPMYHGRPPEELVGFLAERGLADGAYDRLSDPALWGRDPRHDSHVVAGTVP